VKATNIKWKVTDKVNIGTLPEVINIPSEIKNDNEAIGDYIIGATGCQYDNFNLESGSTEYAVHIMRNTDNGPKFVTQIDVFSTLHEAEQFVKLYDYPLNDNEFLEIVYINYDELGNEIESGTLM